MEVSKDIIKGVYIAGGIVVTLGLVFWAGRMSKIKTVITKREPEKSELDERYQAGYIRGHERGYEEGRTSINDSVSSIVKEIKTWIK